MAKILLTGATGFLGVRLAARLETSHELWVLSRRKDDSRGGRRHWLIQDLAQDRWTVDLPERIDAVIHLAQSPNYRDFAGSAAEIFQVSAVATARLLEWARKAGARHFILASTGGLYGASDVAVHEDSEIFEDRGPLGFYFATKRMSELAVAQYAGGMTTAVLRFFFMYGSRQSPQMLMPRLVESIRQGRPVSLQGADGIRINPIHVDDAVCAVEACLGLTQSRTINIAGPDAVSLRRIAEVIGAEVGRDPAFTVDAAAKPRDLVADISRMRTVLGAPATGIAAGLRELCGAAVREQEKT
jgi:nucleoside-diphosphate-sugar epimerase